MTEKIMTVEIVRYANGKKKLNLSVNYDDDMAEVAVEALKIIRMVREAGRPKSSLITTPE